MGFCFFGLFHSSLQCQGWNPVHHTCQANFDWAVVPAPELPILQTPIWIHWPPSKRKSTLPGLFATGAVSLVHCFAEFDEPDRRTVCNLSGSALPLGTGIILVVSWFFRIWKHSTPPNSTIYRSAVCTQHCSWHIAELSIVFNLAHTPLKLHKVLGLNMWTNYAFPSKKR